MQLEPEQVIGCCQHSTNALGARQWYYYNGKTSWNVPWLLLPIAEASSFGECISSMQDATSTETQAYVAWIQTTYAPTITDLLFLCCSR